MVCDYVLKSYLTVTHAHKLLKFLEDTRQRSELAPTVVNDDTNHLEALLETGVELDIIEQVASTDPNSYYKLNAEILTNKQLLQIQVEYNLDEETKHMDNETYHGYTSVDRKEIPIKGGPSSPLTIPELQKLVKKRTEYGPPLRDEEAQKIVSTIQDHEQGVLSEKERQESSKSEETNHAGLPNFEKFSN